MTDGGGGEGGEKGGLYLRLSAQFGEVGGGKRGEGGDEMEREKYKNKKRNTGINKRPGHFLSFMHWTGTTKNYHGGGGFVTGSLRSVLMGVWVKAGRGHKGNKGGGKPSVRDVGTVRGVGLKITMGKT